MRKNFNFREILSSIFFLCISWNFAKKRSRRKKYDVIRSETTEKKTTQKKVKEFFILKKTIIIKENSTIKFEVNVNGKRKYSRFVFRFSDVCTTHRTLACRRRKESETKMKTYSEGTHSHSVSNVNGSRPIFQ